MKRQHVISRLLIITLLICLWGCDQSPAKAPTPKSTKSPATISSTGPKELVHFVGNDLTDSANLPACFKAIAKKDNNPLRVSQYTSEKGTLHKIYNQLIKKKVRGKKFDLAKADYVIFQESDSNHLQTAKYLKKLISLCKPEAKIYFLYTEYDESLSRENELKANTDASLASITYIKSGELFLALLDDVFPENCLLQGNNQPTATYGMAEAILAYRVLTGRACPSLTNQDLKLELEYGSIEESEQDQKLAELVKFCNEFK